MALHSSIVQCSAILTSQSTHGNNNPRKKMPACGPVIKDISVNVTVYRVSSILSMNNANKITRLPVIRAEKTNSIL